jgi:two-component system LytT family sensor kinase
MRASASLADTIEISASPRRLPFFGIFVLWTLFGLWSAQQNVLLTITSGGVVESWSRVLGIALASSWFWALLTPLLMWNTRRVRDRMSARVAVLTAHLATFLIVHVVDAAVYAMLRDAFGSPTRPFVQLVFSLGTFNALTYGVVVMVTTALDYRDALRDRAVRNAQLEAQLAMAHFQTLRAQLHPHFLFNSLNAISALINQDAERAERMLARLSELLRMAIDTAVTPEVRLIDEVEFVKRYLEIEKLRFGDRLSVGVELADDTLDSLVPSMLLQPLVENAVRHGVAPTPGPGRVEIRAERSGAHLHIVVSDTGHGMKTTAVNGGAREGVGLRTTRDRLEKLYGADQELTLVKLDGSGFETRVMLPFRRRAEVSDEDSLPRRR